MSMKLRAVLDDDYRAKREKACLRRDDVITLQKVPCEMTFRATAAWISHESEKHHYLPVFHLTGQVEEIHGDFPYNVSALTFSGEDIQSGLCRDILYYPTPQELAHLIETGKFYTDRFELPDILTANTYSFPALVDLTIVPPPNPVEYEQASFGNRVGVNLDKKNLPIFYASLAGTGIDRKKDALLDYYGIDIDMDYPSYVLTAESSGYTQPTLMEYVVEPPVLDVEAPVDKALYLSPEEEAQLLQQRAQEHQTAVQQPGMTNDYQVTQEDVELEQAQRNIEARVASRVNVLRFERVKEVQATVPDKTMEQMPTAEVQQQPIPDKSKTVTSTLEQLASFTPPTVQPPVSVESPVVVAEIPVEPVAPPDVQNESAVAVVSPEVPEEPVTPVIDAHSLDDGQMVMSQFVHPTVAAEPVTGSEMKAQPEDPESYKHVEITVKNVTDAMMRQDAYGNNQDEQQDAAGLEADEDDRDKLREACGADVSDAGLQAKVDEAKTRDAAQQAAVATQQDLHQTDTPRGTDSALDAIAEKAAHQSSTSLSFGE